MRFAQAQPQLNQIRLDDRRRRQQEFVQLLREHRKSPDLGGADARLLRQLGSATAAPSTGARRASGRTAS